MKIETRKTAFDRTITILPVIFITWSQFSKGFSIGFRFLNFGIETRFSDFFILNSFFHGIKERLKGSELPKFQDELE